MDQASLQKEIHEKRLACGKRLQPTYAQFVDMLNCVLTEDMELPHPYALKQHEIIRFGTQTKLFALGCIGDEATVSGGDYIYRVFKKTHLEDKLTFKAPILKNPDTLWDKLMIDSRQSKDWLDLSFYAKSTYPDDLGDRWFNTTWWTTFPLDNDVVMGAYTIGMFAEWIDAQVYVLRALVEDVNPMRVAHVPTVIDAFLQPVFLPTREPLPITGGVTINLSAYENPTQGVSEFAVKPIDVSVIQIKPILLDLGAMTRHPLISLKDLMVLQSLVNYYDSL